MALLKGRASFAPHAMTDNLIPLILPQPSHLTLLGMVDFLCPILLFRLVDLLLFFLVHHLFESDTFSCSPLSISGVLYGVT